MTITLKNNPFDIFARAYVNAGLCGYVEVREPGFGRTDLDWPLHSSAGEVVTLREVYARERAWNDAAREVNRPLSDRIARWVMHGGTTY